MLCAVVVTMLVMALFISSVRLGVGETDYPGRGTGYVCEFGPVRNK